MENKQLISPSRQCSSIPVGFGQGFFSAKNYVTTLKHHPYSPGLTPTDFYLFPRLKSALKGWCFCVATDIIKNVTKELKRLSKNSFQECFQQFYSHWQKCIDAQGDYINENVV
jgi:hypothetical protein